MSRKSTALVAVLTATAAAAAVVAASPTASTAAPEEPRPDRDVRFATFNASLNRGAAGELVADLSTGEDQQARNVAEIIQRTDPDVLLVNEFDYVEGGHAAELFRDNYLEVSQNGADPVDYPYYYVAPVNTGVASGHDLDDDGSTTGPGDAHGFGFFPGQYGMVVYSKHPLLTDRVRTFQHFRWADMPGNLIPEGYYTDAEREDLRLSSKSHWDVPVRIGRRTVHFLVSHPTPPVFDGPEDRNGTRNADEIRFWADYVGSRARSSYIYDDAGREGGLRPGSRFVVAGDQNSDPHDGDSIPGAIQQLLDHPRISERPTPSSEGAVEASELQGGINLEHESPARFDTADFSEPPGNLRVDYVLPSRQLKVLRSGVFWPTTADPLSRLTAGWPPPSSDHRLVWVDLRRAS